MTYDLVAGYYSERNWQTFDPPACPTALARPGRRAIYQLLSRVRTGVGQSAASVLPSLSPAHNDRLTEEAIGNDCAILAGSGLGAIATDESCWASSSDGVVFEPPPPDFLPLVVAPGQELAVELDYRIAEVFKRRRLTIVGGRTSQQIMALLSDRFEIGEVRWIETDGKKRLQLGALEGTRVERDVVVCVTGYIDHADSERVQAICEKQNMVSHLVERRSEIVALIEKVFGGT